MAAAMNLQNVNELPWTHRLEAQLVAGFLLTALLPVALVASLLIWQGGQVAEAFVTNHVQKTAASYAATLDLFVERQRGRLRDLGPDGAHDLAVLSAAAASDPGLVALWLSDGDTHSTPGPAPWARQACSQLASGLGESVAHAGEDHAHEVVIGVAVGDDTLCGQLSFTPHQAMMSEQADSFLGGSAYIVDRQGVVVCHSFEEEHPHVARGDLLSEKVATVASAGRSWSGRVDADQPHLAAFVMARELPWGVWVDVPRDHAFAPFHQGLIRGGTLALAIALIATLFATWLGRRLATPVQTLARAAARMAEGEMGASVPVQGPAEIALLAREFNAMSNALTESHAELERRVDRRTRELAGARAFSDRLLDTMRQRILVIDPDLRVVRANEAAVRAYGRDLVGCGCHTVHCTPEDAECPAARVMRTGLPAREERTLEREDSTEVLEVETVPLLDEAGETIGALEIAADVTELRRIRDRLAQQQKMAAVGTLAAGLAHEIGNPLASMSSELEMLERMWDPEDARRALPVLRDQVRRMSGLLRELVDFGRPVSDQTSHIAPLLVLEEVARLLGHDPRGRDVRIEVEADPDLVACTSRDRLVQVLVNLGLNALDAVGEGGSVVFRASADASGEVRIDVEDNGPGVPHDAAARVFDPFFTSKPPGRGTGLGLFVSERIAQRLGGRIDLATSEHGARFTVVLPPCACPEVTP